MIVDIILLVAKILGVVLVLIIARAIQLHFQVQGKIKRLTAQGIESYPGNDTFLVGAAPYLVSERKKRGEKKV